jgi:hypothetical protein
MEGTNPFLRLTSIADGWRKYKAAMIPMDISLDALEVHRQAFYAGAATTFFTVFSGHYEGAPSSRAAVGRVDKVTAELESFVDVYEDRLEAGHKKPPANTNLPQSRRR